jgi:hypothetical protein
MVGKEVVAKRVYDADNKTERGKRHKKRGKRGRTRREEAMSSLVERSTTLRRTAQTDDLILLNWEVIVCKVVCKRTGGRGKERREGREERAKRGRGGKSTKESVLSCEGRRGREQRRTVRHLLTRVDVGFRL